MDKYKIDGSKIMHHQERLLQWMNAHTIGDKLKVYPVYVEISPVGHCNHRCSFCALDYLGYIPRILDTRALKDAIGQMANHGVKAIMFAGEGEPLLHKNLSEIINFTRMSGIDVAVTTNGTLMTEGFVTNCLDSIQWIKISLNAGTRDVYNQVHKAKDGDWEKVWQNINFAVSFRNIQGLKCAIGIQCVILPENVDTLDDLLMEAKLSGVDYVVLKPYSQHTSSPETAKKYSNISYNSTETFTKLREKFSDDTFDVVVRENAIEESKRERDYDVCHAVPNFWGYIMSNGDV
jgi:GTP 3',8-cyclase